MFVWIVAAAGEGRADPSILQDERVSKKGREEVRSGVGSCSSDVLLLTQPC